MKISALFRGKGGIAALFDKIRHARGMRGKALSRKESTAAAYCGFRDCFVTFHKFFHLSTSITTSGQVIAHEEQPVHFSLSVTST